MIYFTADWHLDHANILFFEKERPFKNIAKMNTGLIQRHNEVVKENDVVWHLGDFSLRGPENWSMIRGWVHKLNGTHHLVLGNHDKLNPFLYLECGFLTVHTWFSINGLNMCHDPAWSIVDKKAWWLTAHVHSLFQTRKNCINVGVDVNNYRPISIEAIEESCKI